MRIVKEADVRKNEILDAAGILFSEKGYDNTSVTDIMNAVGIAKGTLYHHFKSKEDIMDALIKRQTDAIFLGAKKIAEDKSIPVKERIIRTILALHVDRSQTQGQKMMEQLHQKCRSGRGDSTEYDCSNRRADQRSRNTDHSGSKQDFSQIFSAMRRHFPENKTGHTSGDHLDRKVIKRVNISCHASDQITDDSGNHSIKRSHHSGRKHRSKRIQINRKAKQQCDLTSDQVDHRTKGEDTKFIG